MGCCVLRHSTRRDLAVGHLLVRSRREAAVLEDAHGTRPSTRSSSRSRKSGQRMARELHDIVSHNLSVVVLQAAGARAAGASESTLEKIERSGREALVEMRHLLGVLRAEQTAAALGSRSAGDRAARGARLGRARSGILDVELIIDGQALEPLACARAVGLPHRPRGDHEYAQTRAGVVGAESTSAEAPASSRSRSSTMAAPQQGRAGTGTDLSGWQSGSRSSAASSARGRVPEVASRCARVCRLRRDSGRARRRPGPRARGAADVARRRTRHRSGRRGSRWQAGARRDPSRRPGCRVDGRPNAGKRRHRGDRAHPHRPGRVHGVLAC